jgi:serine/threonine protein kinase
MNKLLCFLLLSLKLLFAERKRHRSTFSGLLDVRDDTVGIVMNSFDKDYVDEYRKMKLDLLPGVNPFYVDPDLIPEKDEKIQMPPEFKINNRIKDCRAMYLKLRVKGRALHSGRNKVYLVQDIQTNQLYVYKSFESPDEYSRELFAMQVTNHPNLVKGICFHKDKSDRAGIVMEYIDGKAGTDWAHKAHYDQIKFVMAQFLVALHYLHSVGLIHCDVKPGNFKVEKSTGRGVLLDFGFTIPRDEFRYQIGTNTFVAPEMHGKVPGPITSAVDSWGWSLSLASMVAANLLGSKYPKKKYYPMTRVSKQFEFSPAPVNLPQDVRELLAMTLTLEQQHRTFHNDKLRDKIKNHAYFNGVDWDSIDPELAA